MQDLKNFKILKKAGSKITDTKKEDDLFFNKAKEQQFKKTITIKSLICIFLTNMMTYTALSSNQVTPTVEAEIEKGMTSLSLPIQSYIPKGGRIPKVKLVGPSNEMIAEEVIIENLTEEVVDVEDQEVPVYVVTVKDQDASKFLNYRNKLIRAYPMTVLTRKRNATGAPHEIRF
ncbi:hypothetical protein [Bacteriovorax sp. Seq25_V]|uniref:hypothetical protein n=1 Tax=Bacteriovorax sp. Seq25_V TaxID=1201288 RepID=UPI00038A4FD9|nr:hypothetical protein [Bacteriovorax sp. Seq25_V]EQC46606.1 hypothetical protein M900_2403 [Bacteriovorax sp. Seq25_V]